MKNMKYIKLFDSYQAENDDISIPNNIDDKAQMAHYSKDKNIIKILSKDPKPYIRMHVAGNINTPIEILEELAKDSDGSVRLGVINNINISTELLEELAKDSDYNLSSLAKQALSKKK